MKPYIWVLILLILLVGLYEFGGLMGYYPTITATVSGLPLVWVIAIAVGFVTLAVHFIRAWQRGQRK